MLRVIAKPLLTKGGREYGDPVEITGHCLSPLRIKESIDKSDWEAGIATVDRLTLSLFNGDDWFDDGGGGHPEPVFAPAGRHGSRIEIYFGTTLLFAGYVQEEDSKQNYGDYVLKLSILSPLSILRDTTINTGLITSASTPETAVRTILQSARQLEIGTIDMPATIQEANIFTESGYFTGISAYKALNEILITTGSVAIIEYSNTGNDKINIVQVGDVLNRPELVLADPNKAQWESGYKRLLNRVEFANGLSVQYASSIQEFGEKSRTLDFDWIAVEQRDRIGAAILTDHVATPRDLLKISTTIYPDMFDNLRLLGIVVVQIRERYKTLVPGEGYVLGQELPVRETTGLNFRGRIIRLDLDLYNNQAMLTLERTEVEYIPGATAGFTPGNLGPA